MEKEKYAIEKTPLILSLFCSVLILVLHFTYLFVPISTHSIFYKLMEIVYNTGIFKMHYYPHLLSLGLGLLYVLGVKPMKSEYILLSSTLPYLIIGLILYGGSIFYFSILLQYPFVYIGIVVLGYLMILMAMLRIKRIIDNNLLKDQFNKKNRRFRQERRKIENDYSVNIKTKDGWLNVINPFRATMVLGTPGSGKSYTVVEEFIRQHMQKQFTMLVYDFKYPALSEYAYSCYLKYYRPSKTSKYQPTPTVYIINLNDPENSHRINPIAPYLLKSPSDAISTAESLFLNINRDFIKKKDFFTSSAVNLLGAIIWYLRKYEQGKYCTIPHAITLLNQGDKRLIRVLSTEPEVKALITPFADALEKSSLDQLAGQTASARIPISRLATKQLYWILGGEDFRLDINHPKNPAIIFLANHPESQSAYGPVYGLIASTLVKVVNQKNRLPLSLIIDELPTIFINGLDHLIATARSNRISTLLSFQDLAQLERDYSREVANTIFNTVGNKICGAVVAETAKKISDMIGKAVQKRANINYTSKGTSTGTSTTLDYLIPPETIAQLSQGEFCGVLADTYEQALTQKIFQSHLIVDKKKISQKSIPSFSIDDNKEDKAHHSSKIFEKLMHQNYQKIIRDVEAIISSIPMEPLKEDARK